MKFVIAVPLIALAMIAVLFLYPFFKMSGKAEEDEREWTTEEGDDYGV